MKKGAVGVIILWVIRKGGLNHDKNGWILRSSQKAFN